MTIKDSLKAADSAAGQPTLPDLDNPQVYTALDPSGLRFRLRSLPGQCRAAWNQAGELLPDGLPNSLPDGLPNGSAGRYDRVVIGGMGGSAIAGDLAADLAALQPTVPVVVVRNFHLPFVLSEHSLFIACSHSGNTRETLSLFRQARAAGAQILAITAGGVLAEEAGQQGVPILPVDAPGEPRSAVGYNLILLLGILHRLSLVNMPEAAVADSLTMLEEQLSLVREDTPTPDNPAKSLARELTDKLVVMYGGGIFSGVARRWKTQLNENAKVWAFYESLPESLHNSVEPYGVASAVGQEIVALLLRPHTLSPELAERYRVLAEMLRRGRVNHRELAGPAGPPLGQLLATVLLGDYVSYYLALLRGLDPSPTPAIEQAKSLADR